MDWMFWILWLIMGAIGGLALMLKFFERDKQKWEKSYRSSYEPSLQKLTTTFFSFIAIAGTGFVGFALSFLYLGFCGFINWALNRKKH